MSAPTKPKTLAVLLIYFGAVVTLGALLAPWIARAGAWAVHQWPWLPWGGDTPLHRYFNRSIMLVALVGLWPLTRALALRSWADIGFGPNKDFAKQLSLGVAIAVTSALLFALFAAKNPLNFHNGLLRAPVVALMEETFFRGVLLSVLLRALSPAAALTATSLFFSTVHFLKPRGAPPLAQMDWHSGLGLLPSCFQDFTEAATLAPFVNLALVGLIVGWAFWRTRSLAMPLGLHGGWVLATAGTVKLSWIATPALAATLALVVWLTRPRSSASAPSS